MSYPTSVAVTAGVGTGIAFDLVSGVNFQVVKIDVGATGASALLGTANPLPITPITPAIPTTQGLSWTKIDSAAGGNLDIVAGVAAQTVRVFALFFTVQATVTVQLADSTPTTLTGAMTFGAGGGLVLDPAFGPGGLEPWLVSASGKGFRIVMGAAIQISGMVGWKQS